MAEMNITVKNKIATKTDNVAYVCDNSDYIINFDFDSEWDAYETKTARFAHDGQHTDVVFTGNQCNVPIITNTYAFYVGVFAGDLHTTTGALVPCRKSVRSADGAPANPTPDVYDQLMELIKGLGGVDPDDITKVVADYLAAHPIEETDPTVPEWAKQTTKPTYTAAEVGALPDTYTPPNQTAQQVGADPAGTAASAVSQHNTDTVAHNDLRVALQGLSNRINAALDSDDTTMDQMSEVVAYIKSNKSMIDAITTSKVSVADIVNNLTTNISNKPLSAAQGVALKELIDALSNSMTAYRTAAAQDVIDSGKVDKVTGKGLSSNDYTDAAKAKVDALAPVATSGDYDDLTNKPTIHAPVTEQTVSGWGFTKNTGTYSKPTGGIPKADLANDVQASLGKADTALQEHQSLAAYRTAEAQNIIDKGKQDKITSTNKLAYSLISGTPTIPTVPTNVSSFTNDVGYLTLATLPKYEGVVE